MPVQWKRLSEPRGAGASAHTYRSEPNGPPSPATRSRRAGTKPYGLETGLGAGRCRTVSHNVNTVLLQCAPNLFNLLLIHTTNANATVDITITVLNNFELKRDTVQAKNYLSAQ